MEQARAHGGRPRRAVAPDDPRERGAQADRLEHEHGLEPREPGHLRPRRLGQDPPREQTRCRPGEEERRRQAEAREGGHCEPGAAPAPRRILERVGHAEDHRPHEGHPRLGRGDENGRHDAGGEEGARLPDERGRKATHGDERDPVEQPRAGEGGSQAEHAQHQEPRARREPPERGRGGRHAEEHPRSAHPEGDHVVGEAAPRPEHRARREHREEAHRARLETAGGDPEHGDADRDRQREADGPPGAAPRQRRGSA